MEPLDSSSLVWEDFRNALGNMDVWIEDNLVKIGIGSVFPNPGLNTVCGRP